MEEKLKFRMQNLLAQKNGKVFGPMSPILFANEMAEASRTPYNRLARLWFDDDRINQTYEDGGLTGYDTLIIGTDYGNDLLITLWVDSGTGSVPVAMGFLSDRDVQLTQVYAATEYARSLTEAEVREIFAHVFDNSDQLTIGEE